MKNEIGIKMYSPADYKNHEEAELVFEITNLTNKTLHILKWNTPLEGLISPCLEVKAGNKKIEYDGVMLKRGAPQAKDFYTLKPGENVISKVDLTSAYDISKPGEVKVNFDPEKFVYYADQPLTAAVTASASGFKKKTPAAKAKLNIKPTTFKVKKGTGKRITEGQYFRQQEQKKKKLNLSAGLTARKKVGLQPCTVKGGTASKKAIARTAHTNGYALAKAALADLLNNAKYKQWFGKYAKTRFNKVKKNYQTVITTMETTPFTYDLSGKGCESGVFAYTYKGTSTIWFCDAFWAAPNTGTDSRAGTVVHEHTHASAGTDDIQYGQEGCQQLAKTRPNDSVMNADTHEYYAGG